MTQQMVYFFFCYTMMTLCQNIFLNIFLLLFIFLLMFSANQTEVNKKPGFVSLHTVGAMYICNNNLECHFYIDMYI